MSDVIDTVDVIVAALVNGNDAGLLPVLRTSCYATRAMR